MTMYVTAVFTYLRKGTACTGALDEGLLLRLYPVRQFIAASGGCSSVHERIGLILRVNYKPSCSCYELRIIN